MGMKRNGRPSAMKTRQLTAMPKLILRLMVVMRYRPKVVMTNPMATSRRGSNLGARAPATGKRNMSTMPPEETAMPAWRGGVAHDLLQKLRDQHGGRIERDAHHEHDELCHADVAAGEQAQVENRVLDGELAPEEERRGRWRR